MNGLGARVWRDIIFGATYSSCRRSWASSLGERIDMSEHAHHLVSGVFIANCAAAAVATVVSGPMNYVQNMQYATSSRNHQLSIVMTLSRLANETTRHRGVFRKAAFLQARLRIGWGTFRVALGMGIGNYIYETLLHTV